VLLTVIVYVGKFVTSLLTGLNPESNPAGVHGLAKELAVTVWFFSWNSKVTVSPTWAMMLDGVKARVPTPPTITL